MSKIIYLIHPVTRVLVGSAAHPLDPVETERAGEPVYALLNPELATEQAPPKIPPGERAVMLDRTWTLEPIPAPPGESEPALAPQPVANLTELPAPDLGQRLAALRALVQEYLDAMARSLGYDDIKSAVSYADEPSVPRFQNEGRAFRAWRSLVWADWYELVARVEAGEAAEPTPEGVADLLPRLVIPPLMPPTDTEEAPAAELAAASDELPKLPAPSEAPEAPAKAQADGAPVPAPTLAKRKRATAA